MLNEYAIVKKFFMSNNHDLRKQKSSGAALLPFLVFIIIYLGAGLFLQAKGVAMAFYQFPSVSAMFVAVLVAFAMTRGTLGERFSIFARGVGKEDIITMLIIYILAGAFSSVAAAMGGRDATVNMGLTFIPVRFLAAGIFIIAAFMSTATGTSMGTVGAIIPIVIGIADKGHLSIPLVIGACIGGAMFGDNLSMISDTTIAATRTQGVGMKDKFHMNFLISLPSAIITIILLLIFGRPETIVAMKSLDFSFIKVVPYIAVLVLALIGMNVFLVLTIGIFMAGIIGMCYGKLTVFTFAQKTWEGFTSMNEVFFLTLLVAGMAEIVMHNGGINWLLEKLEKVMKGKKSAQVGISLLTSLIDCATANNTVSIVVVGALAKKVSSKYKIDPRRTASLLDIFSCCLQGVLPYGAQILMCMSLANAYLKGSAALNPTSIVPYVWYCMILFVVAMISIFVPFADGFTRKNPWNWEYDCAESEVEEVKKIKAENREIESEDPDHLD